MRSHLGWLRVVTLFSCFVTLASCGSTDNSKLFQSNETGGNSGTGATGNTAGVDGGTNPATGGIGGAGGTMGNDGSVVTGGAPSTGGFSGATGGASPVDSGSGATGGTTTIPDASTGGTTTTPDASAGGTTTTPDAGTGGTTTGDSGSDGADASAPPNADVRCDSTVCDPGFACCISSGEASCTSLQDTTSCGQVVTCDEASDCPTGTVCCAEAGTFGYGAGDFRCLANCPAGEATIGCGGPSDCPDGQICCGKLNNAQTRYTSTSCAGSCNGNRLCDSRGDCGDNEFCRQSDLLPPGFRICEAN